jgi:hypothetical protein
MQNGFNVNIFRRNDAHYLVTHRQAQNKNTVKYKEKRKTLKWYQIRGNTSKKSDITYANTAQSLLKDVNASADCTCNRSTSC